LRVEIYQDILSLHPPQLHCGVPALLREGDIPVGDFIAAGAQGILRRGQGCLHINWTATQESTRERNNALQATRTRQQPQLRPTPRLPGAQYQGIEYLALDRYMKMGQDPAATHKDLRNKPKALYQQVLPDMQVRHISSTVDDPDYVSIILLKDGTEVVGD
jgi:hypothetical protein